MSGPVVNNACGHRSCARRHARRARVPAPGATPRPGFTLIEVLATLVLLGIVLPVAMRGLSVALSAASKARHTATAAQLAETKLNEMVVGGQWSTTVVSGDFSPDYPQYQWTCQTSPRDYGLTEIVLTVTWIERGSQRSLSLSTLAADLQNADTLVMP